MNRLEVHSHTEYSNIRLLDCINKTENLINRAIEIGLKGICVTDHECLSSAIELNELQQKLLKEESDFKIGLGNEIYLCDTREPKQKYYHFILIAKNAVGHKQLRRLSSRAWMNSFEDRRLERVVTLKSDLKEIIGNEKGNLIATTACIGGELSQNILLMEGARANLDTTSADIYKEKIINFVLEMKDIFGSDFYFEVAPAASKDQIIVNKKIAELSKVFDVKMVIGTDAHYLTPKDKYVHEAFLNSKGGERETAQFYEYAYLQTEEDIIKNLAPSIVNLYEQMCENSMEIYNKIEYYSLLHPQVIPSVDVKDYPKLDAGDNEKYPIITKMYRSDDIYERYWINECANKLEELNLAENTVYWDRLEEEADIKKTISEKLGTNMFSYPITLQHYIDLIWDCGSTVGAGRGSSCSGLNHYLLGVTQLDPIEWNLPFWRYLNKERIELGDIDIDIAPSKKSIILQKIKEERGQKFLPYIDSQSRKNLGCTLVATFGTETSKSAIKTACRGYRSEEYPNGIDADIATYLSSLVPVERGFVWSLNDVVNGNEEKDRKPVNAFVEELKKYPGLYEIMTGVEGLISKRSSHASGVIFFDEDPYEFGCFMRTPNGEIITQYDLHKAEAAGMTKYDFLVTSAQDKIIETIKLLQTDGLIDSNLTIREVYDKYLHPSKLDIEDNEVWKKIQNVEVLNLFQFDSDVGSQAAKKIKPSSMLELSDANGLMRLMTAEKGAETPMEKYIRFKNNINLWYEEMTEAGLTKEEQETLKPHFLKSHGVPPSQEQLMTMLMDKNICNFSLKDANAARKIVGKKQMNKIPMLHQQVLDQAKSPALGEYVWKCGIGPQMGYSFSIIHALAYSFIAYQMAVLATKYNPLYWNCACLIVNSEAIENLEDDEDEDDDEIIGEKKKNKNADYEKIAKALSEMMTNGVKVSLVNINESGYTFKPDVANNRILYGLKPLARVNEDIYEKIIAGRPYQGIKDFMTRCPLDKPAMISLIKAGAFDEVEKVLAGRREIMAYYLKVKSEPKTKLNLQNFATLVKLNLFPKEMELTTRLFNFNKYIKGHKYGNYFTLDDYCYDFLYKNYPEAIDYTTYNTAYGYLLDNKAWDKIYQKGMDVARGYIKEHQQKLLTKVNDTLFMIEWNKYAQGNLSKWEMDSLCFYYHKHELSDVNVIKYGISNFFELPKDPVIEYMYLGKIPIYSLSTVIGTVIAKNDAKSSITLLSCQGVFTVKFTRDYYSMFKKQISMIDPETGKKKVMEKGWFAKGTKIMVTGYRRDDMFISKTYAKTIGHQLYKINSIYGDGITLQHDRYTAADVFEEEENEEWAS